MKKNMERLYRRALLRGIAYQALHLFSGLLGAGAISLLLELAIQARGNALTHAALLALGAIALCACLQYWLWKRWERGAQDGLHRHRKALLRQMLEGALPVETGAEADVRLQRDAETTKRHWVQTLPEMGVSAFFALICAAILAWLNAELALVFILLSLLQLLPTLVYEKWAKPIYQQVLNDEEAYCSWVGEGLHGISTLKTYRQERWFLERFGRCCEKMIRSGRLESRTAAIEDIVTELIRTLLEYGSYLIVGMAAMAGKAAVTQLPFLLIVAQRMFSFVAAVVQNVVKCFQYQKTEERLKTRKAMETKHPPDGYAAALQGVTKAYEGKTVLKNVSIQVRRGDRILLSGANGSGKTTLLRLLLGFCQPEMGEAFPPAEAAFVFQEEPDLDEVGWKIAEEMTKKGTISRAAFLEHCAAFQIGNMLSVPLPECSQGQRKKFYLALALARQAELLVLDEPTNHLEPPAAEYLAAQLEKYPGTLLLCTHDPRLAPVGLVRVNRHLRLDGGQVYERRP